MNRRGECRFHIVFIFFLCRRSEYKFSITISLLDGNSISWQIIRSPNVIWNIQTTSAIFSVTSGDGAILARIDGTGESKARCCRHSLLPQLGLSVAGDCQPNQHMFTVTNSLIIDTTTLPEQQDHCRNWLGMRRHSTTYQSDLGVWILEVFSRPG